MYTITNCILTIIIIYIFSSIVNTFISKSGLGLLTQLVLNFLMLASCTSVFSKSKFFEKISLNINKSFNKDIKELEKSDTLIQQIANLTKIKLEHSIDKMLKTKEILPNKVDVLLDTNDKSNITINEVKIYVNKEYSKHKNSIKYFLSNFLETTAEKIKVYDEFGKF